MIIFKYVSRIMYYYELTTFISLLYAEILVILITFSTILLLKELGLLNNSIIIQKPKKPAEW